MSMIQDTIPWFKQPLVWMLIAIPFSAIVMGVIIIYLAVTTDDGLVAEDYYKKGLTINRQIAKEVAATDFRLQVVIDVDVDTGYIQAKFDKGQMSDYPSQLQLALRHASKEQNDVFVILQKGIGNNYVGSIADGVQHGVWHIELSNLADETTTPWRLTRRVRLEGTATITIPAE